MDPDACLREFYEALADGDFRLARDRWDDLDAWIAMGGAEPQGDIPRRP